MRADQDGHVGHDQQKGLGLIALLLCGIVFLLAGLTMVGWWFRIAPLVQLRSGWAPMQFNTALSFVLGGLALGAELLCRRKSAQWTAAVLAALVLVTLIQYLTGLNWGIDQLFAEPFVIDSTSHPGRMSPNTGLCFLALSTSVFLRHSCRLGALASAGVLSSMVAATSLVTLLIYALGLPTDTGFRNLTAMALTTALGMLLLSLVAFQNSRIAQSRHFQGQAVSWFPVALGLSLAFFTVVLWGALIGDRERELQREAGLLAELLGHETIEALELTAARLGEGGAPKEEPARAPTRTALDEYPFSRSQENGKMATSEARRAVVCSCGLEEGALWMGVRAGGARWWAPIVGDDVLGDFVFEHAHMGYSIEVSEECLIFGRGHSNLSRLGLASADFRWKGLPLRVRVWSERLGHTAATTLALLLGLLAAAASSLFVAGLQLSRARARELNAWTEGAPLGLFLVDREGRIRRVNRRALDVFAASRDEVCGSMVESWVPKAKRKEHLAHRVGFVNQSGARLMGPDGQVQLRRRDGSLIHVELGIGPVRIAGVDFVLCAISDIESRVQAEASLAARTDELSAANEELKRFSSALSHDLRAPIRGMSTLASFIQEDDGERLSEESREHLRMIRHRGSSALSMVDGLLELARMGASDEQAEQVDVELLVREAFSLVSAPETFRLQTELDVPPLLTVRAALFQVVFNLIANAVRHHDREGGTLLVGGRVVDAMVRIRVTDDGPGVPDEFKSEVFSVFRRLAKDNEKGGVGLGLPLVKKRVESFGGEVRLEDALPRGLSVVFSWPMGRSLQPSRRSSGPPGSRDWT